MTRLGGCRIWYFLNLILSNVLCLCLQDGSWQCFRGDGSGEDLIFRVERTLNTLTRTEFNIFLGGANCEDSTDFKMKGCPFQRSCTIYKGNSIVAQVLMLTTLQLRFCKPLYSEWNHFILSRMNFWVN